MNKIIMNCTFIGCITATSLSAESLITDNLFDDVFVGVGLHSSKLHKTTSGTMEFKDTDRHINVLAKLGFEIDEDQRMFGQFTKFSSTDVSDFDYTSYSLNYEIDLANKFGWKPFAGVHAGIGTAVKIDDNGVKRENVGIEYGAQAGIRKKVFEHLEAEGGYRWTKQSTELRTATGNIKNNYVGTFYTSVNLSF